ncbi:MULTISPECIES: toll/interleukin-1 receptor domain-containing protein [Afipia]|jgi:hypothetical protein|uniref:TIR domain-containing protein n=1 Tax=Afipia massiliensis TaxID=211460 RepID=A0A840N758_9BRAD|nr:MULTISPECIES: toll/interleukin-1 receptor domain-containing protein [Afipia]MBB5053601.1 hypothetical protein [Afipia massiliensis]WIG52230.1 MAG: hypothetical protein OJF48_003148 [Afipia sp.]
MSLYEIAIIGSVSDEKKGTLIRTISNMLSDFGLEMGSEILLHDGPSCASRNRHVSFAAVYFGGSEHRDIEAARQIVFESAPIIPTIDADAEFAASIPSFLHAANALRRRTDDPEMKALAVALLECLGLLRAQRRVFVSYRRTESRNAAIQLHDLMRARGFDVFLDTHDIRPGNQFQDILWHRLCDSDVMVVLDTPAYFESKWTRQEFSRALAKEIHILRVIWPDHSPNRLTDMAETTYLDHTDLPDPEGPIADAAAEGIVLAVESLRSRSIASRYMSITGKLGAEVKKIGAEVKFIGPHRAINIRLNGGGLVWAYPIVGVPTADLLNDIEEKAKRAGHGPGPVLVYDDVGIGEQWKSHLKWLDDNIKSVQAMSVSEAAWILAAREA